MQQEPAPLPTLPVSEVEEFFHGLEAQLKVPTPPTVSSNIMTTPTTVAEQRQPPKRPVKHLNGKQMIKMQDSPIARPNRRKGEPKQANSRNIVAIRFCKHCRPRIQKELTAAHRTIACCPKCVLCTCG
ncbi:hypothetical protein CAEBREN_16174 [Caenorhabditis brenneri]|uniref:Uncharacterized protein n=1 Tax=Caenorhabditis brenneri TaxID=135651 RepID=G0PH90_CAEBE|nr:hypothetical protein CAEBREN_16174 [Caenorhabditis brenneri]